MSNGASIIIHQIIVDLAMNSTQLSISEKSLEVFKISSMPMISYYIKNSLGVFQVLSMPFHPRLHFFFSLNMWLNAIIVLRTVSMLDRKVLDNHSTQV
jgi:hypothetical protein